MAVALYCDKICGRQTFVENQRDPTSQSKSGSNGLPMGAFDSSGSSYLMSIVRSIFMMLTATFSLSSVTVTENTPLFNSMANWSPNIRQE